MTLALIPLMVSFLDVVHSFLEKMRVGEPLVKPHRHCIFRDVQRTCVWRLAVAVKKWLAKQAILSLRTATTPVHKTNEAKLLLVASNSPAGPSQNGQKSGTVGVADSPNVGGLFLVILRQRRQVWGPLHPFCSSEEFCFHKKINKCSFAAARTS